AYALSTHCRPCSEKRKSAPIEGSATIVIVPSRSTMKNAPQRSASAHQRRGSRPAGARRATGADDFIINLRSRLARIVRAVDEAETAAPGKWASAGRPVSPLAGVSIRDRGD